MASVTELLAQYASTPPAATPSIGNPLAANVRRNEGVSFGSNQMSEVENDLNTLNPAQLTLKYGRETASTLINQRLQGDQQMANYQYLRDNRTAPEAVIDTVSGVATGFGQSFAGIGALGLGMVNRDAGSWAANKIDQGQKWVQENIQSDGLNAARQMDAVRNEMTEDASKQLAEVERMVGAGEQSIAVNRFLRDATGTVANALEDPVIATQGTAEAVGSLLAGGPISKGLKGIGSTVLKAAGKISGAPLAAAYAGSRVAPLAMPASIAAMEAGGAYQQTVADITSRSHDQLMRESAQYRDLIKQGMSQTDAKNQIANDAGLTAAAIQAPIAAATGALVAPFEASPLTPRGLATGLGNLAKETVEEGIQSTTGQLAQNYADREFANNKADLLEGVGAQAGLGALYGFTSAGAVQAPGTAVKATATAGRLTMQGARSIKGTVLDRIAKVEEDNNKASPIADATMRDVTAAAVEQAPVNFEILGNAVDAMPVAPAAKAEAMDYINGMSEALAVPEITPEQLAGMPEELGTAFTTATNRVEAMQNLAEVAGRGEGEVNFNAALMLHSLSQELNDFRLRESAALDQLDSNAPAKKILSQYQNLITDINNTPNVRKMLALADRYIAAQVREADLAQRMSDENIETENGKQAAQVTIKAAESEPGSVPAAAIDAVLYQNSRGRLNLTEPQRAALMLSRSILDQADNYNTQVERLGLRRAQDIVGKQITTDTIRKGDGTKSAMTHARGVVDAMRAGNFDAARALLGDFGLFVDHMNNKVAAANQHFRNGDPKAQPVSYQSLQPDRTWKESPKGMFVNTTSPNSLELNQQVSLEADALTNIYNSLAQAFPSLQLPQKNAVPLDAALDGEIQAVADSFGRPQAQPRTDDKKAETAESTPVEATVVETTPTPAVVEETAPVAETVEEEAPVADAEPVEQAAPVERTPEHELFPDMDPSSKFFEGFRVPNEPTTNMIAISNPLETVFNLFNSSDSLRDHIGPSLKAYLTPEILGSWQAAMNWGLGIKAAADANLQAYLDRPYSKSDSTKRRDRLDVLAQTPAGRVLSIVENDNGKLKYNDNLLELAVLAAVDFRVNMQNYIRPMDAAALDAYTGMQDAMSILDPGTVDLLQQGMGTAEAKRQLARKIQNYWGLSQNNNTSLAYSQGIAESLAGEMVRALVADGTLVEETVSIDTEDGPKKFNRYIPKFLDKEVMDVQGYPNAIEQVVMKNPEQTHYIGEKPTTVARTQMNNPSVENTVAQRRAIAAKQDVPFQIHMPMVNVYASIGERNIVEMFGTMVTPGTVLNETHASSIEGKNRSIVAGYQSLLGVVANAMNVAQASDSDVGTVDIHYARNVSSVGRMQMLGAHSPQANKLVREAILPTFATLDLNEGTEHLGNFKIAIGQHLGIKVHNMTREAGITKTDEWLAKMTPAIEVLGQMTSENYDLQSSDIPTIKAAFAAIGEKVTPGAIHALVEYSRYQAAADKSAFRTPLYVEADGVTNGPINAMGLLSLSKFNRKWLKNIAKGGVFFNIETTTNDHRAFVDQDDLYTEATNNFKIELAAAKKYYNSKDHAQSNNFMTLLDLFNPDLRYDGKDISLKRGIAKNPLTITLYGSGERGIAGNFQQAMSKAIYERMSQMATAMNADSSLSRAEAMFPENPASYGKMVNAYRAITGVNLDTVDPVTFVMDQQQARLMTKTAKTYFVVPMSKAITTTVGQPLMKAVTLLRKATQVQSIYAEQYFKDLIDAEMQDRKDFLSPNELKSLYDQVRAKYPMITTGEQTFNVSGRGRYEAKGSVLGAALNDQFRNPALINAPADAGVSGIPFMTIGMGDAVMMQLLAQRMPGRTLDVFDGLNVPLDAAMDYSREANKAVYDSWRANPFQYINEMFKNSDFTYPVSAEMHTKLSRALFGFGAEAITSANLIAEVNALSDYLDYAQRSVDARHKAMQTLNMTVDQMAAMGAPHTNTASLDPALNTEAAVLAALNAVYEAEMAKAEPVQEATKQPEVATSTMYDSLGRLMNSGVRVLSPTAMAKLGKVAGFTPAQQVIYGEIMRSQSMKDWKIVHGTAEQIRDFQLAKGLQTLPSDADPTTVQGYTVFGDKTIYTTSTSAETALHEMIHASTLEKLVAHYDGNSTTEVSEAVARIEELMAQFMASTESSTDIDNARSAITEAAVANADQTVAKAASLNEFMAWTLANTNLSEAAAARTAPSLVQLVKDAFKWIKQLIWGRKKAPKIGEDALSNLQFNTGVIIRSQPSTAQVVNDTVAFQNDRFGNKDELTKVMDVFATKVAAHMNTPVGQNVFTNVGKTRVAAQNAVDMVVLAQSNGFPMTPQEDNAFRHYVAAMQTELSLDPNAMQQAQTLYDHVKKNMHFEDLVDAHDTDPNSALYYAAQKYDVLMGNYAMPNDEQGRSNLLPMFLGLALVSDEVRSVLSNMDVPKRAKEKALTVDQALNNFGTDVMDSLNNRLSGQGNAKNVRDALDNLLLQTAQTAEDTQTAFDVLASKPGGMSDRVNQYIVDTIETVTDKAIAKADQVISTTNSKTVAAVAKVVQYAASMATEKNGEMVAQSAITQANTMKLMKPLHDLITDLVGRTENNSAVYDMIKQVRSVVQKVRQQFREHLPSTIASKFSRKLSEAEWSTLHTSLGKTDLSLLTQHMTDAKVGEMITNDRLRHAEVSRYEQDIEAYYQKEGQQVLNKAKQLAKYMMTGEVGPALLRNAEAISRLLGVAQKPIQNAPRDMVNTIDKLVTLYAIDNLSADQKATTVDLFTNESQGVSFALSYLRGLRETEASKTVSNSARLNQYKGYIPSLAQEGVQLIVADDSEFSQLAKRSFTRIGTYGGSIMETGQGKRGYYYAKVSGRAAFSQGIVQNVRHTVGGVDASNGFSLDNTSAGRITDRRTVDRLSGLMNSDRSPNPLMPVFSDTGRVVAFERSMDKGMIDRVKQDTHLAKMLGVWRGRQVEEMMSGALNEQLIDALHDMFTEDGKKQLVADQYIDLWNTKDPVYADAWKVVPNEVRDYIRDKFGGETFMVRKDMINDAVGYRSASVGDMWNGNTRWSDTTKKTVTDIATGIFGNKAYQYMVNGEKIIQNFVGDARTLIVVKSVIVPISNMLSNLYQLVARGVPLASMVRGTPRKLSEINSYVQSSTRLIDAEAELLAARGQIQTVRRLETEIQSIRDSHKRLSIWPLIEAGEFTAISDVGLTQEDHDMASGKFYSAIESWVNKLPPGVRTAGRYALITKDTALFQGLQKSIQYGDFIAKALLYDDLVIRQKKEASYAKGRISEEFVNYDRLPGRFRGYVESMGLLWFWNFKIRSSKVALSMIRNNPLHAMLAMAAPAPTMFGTVGLPIEDNLFTKLGDGSLDYSVGLGQAFRAPTLNPWWNLAN